MRVYGQAEVALGWLIYEPIFMKVRLQAIFLFMMFCFFLSTVSVAKGLSYLSEEENAWLNKHQDIRLGVDPAWQPFEFIENGRYKGIASSYINDISNKLSLEMKVKSGLSWTDVLDLAKKKALDVLPCVVNTAVRREFLLFTEPYLDFPMVIVSRDDMGYIRSIDSIVDQKIGVVDGYASIDLLLEDYPELVFHRFKTLSEGLKAVSLGQVDYFIDNLASISHVINKRGLVNLKVAAETPYSFKLSIGVRNDWPELVSILNKVLAQTTANEKDQIIQRWVSIRFDHGIDHRLMFILIGLLLAIAIILYLIFHFRNQRLRSQLREIEKENLIGTIAQKLDTVTGQEFFQTLVNELAKSLGTDFAFVGRFEKKTNQINAFVVYGEGKPLPPFIYDLLHTPCEATLRKAICVVPEKVQQQYPDDELLAQMNINGYAGMRLNDSSGNTIGILVVLTKKMISDTILVEHLLQIFGLRAAFEFERQEDATKLQKLSQAIEFSPNAVVITDRQGVIEYVNPRYTEITGYTEEEVIGEVHKTLQINAGDTSLQMNILFHLHKGEKWQGEMRNVKKDGTTYWAFEHFSPILDKHGVVTHFVAMQQDVTLAHEASEKASYQESYDSLTGLINRHEFEIRLDLAVKSAVKKGQEHVLCFLDLDQFKVVNDTAGHIAGDEMLKQVSVAFSEQIVDTDILARLGGDEFAVLLKNCPMAKGLDKAQELLSVIEDFRFEWDDKVFTLGMSVGIAIIDSTSKSHVEALKFADIACYTAKDAGRNRIHVYQSDDDEMLQRSGEMLWAPRINKALENDDFRLFVQEIRPTDPSLDYVNYEVLLRLQEDDGRMVPPGAFLPTAERYNLITKVDLWVIDHTFAWLKKHAKKFHPDMHFSVNLSGQSMGDNEILKHITDLLDSGSVSSSQIHFEVTETMAIANLKQANHFIKTVKAYGCKFSLDDFGSGLSSFGYLKNLNVDTLKIDGMFVRDIIDDEIDAEMVSSINNIGHVMGMETIAEFVENSEIAQKLIAMNVNYLQGYGIGKPRPIDDIL